MRTVPVLLYHSVSNEPPAWIRRFAVTPHVFQRQLALIRESGAVPLRVSDYAAALAGKASLPERAVVITFDDGLADFRNQAMPALDDAGLSATLFVTSGFLEGEPLPREAMRPEGPWLDRSAIVELRASGVEIGAHGHTHQHLDTLSIRAARAEIARPKEELEEILGEPVLIFAYPHGYYSDSVRGIVRETGYTSACAVKNALSLTNDDVFALARLTIRRDTSLAELAAWLDGRGAPLACRNERLATQAWRAFRRSRAIVQRRPGSDWA